MSNHDNEDIARMMKNWTRYVQLPTECNASLQLAIVRELEQIEIEAQELGEFSNTAKAFRIHAAIVRELEPS